MSFSALQEQYPLVVSIVMFVVILLLTWLVEHVIFKLIKGIGQKTDSPLPSSTIFANIARVAIWLAGISIGAKIAFNYDLTGIVAALGVGGIALSLGMQDTLQNLIGGLQVSIGKLVTPGEYIQVSGERGQVEDVTWRHTTMVDPAGKRHIIPNSVINKTEIIELGTSGDVAVPFLLPVGTNIEQFSVQAKAAIEAELGDQVGNKGVRILFGGSEYGGIRGQVLADCMRSAGPEGVMADRISRAIDNLLNPAV